MPDIFKSILGRRIGLSAAGRLLVDPVGRGAGASGIILPNTNAGPSTALSNFTAQRAFDTYATIPAGSLEVGSVIRIRYQGIQTAVNGTDTSQILNIGSTLAASTLAVTGGTALTTSTAAAGVANNIFHGEYELQVSTVGSSGTMAGVGIFKKVLAAEQTYSAVDDILASTTIDTTVDQIVCVGLHLWCCVSLELDPPRFLPGHRPLGVDHVSPG
jgi:hypothetical protein